MLLVHIELSELVCYEIKGLYAVTVAVHKCEASLSLHHPGQSVHRLNTPSKESQWPCSDILIMYNA